MDDGPVAAVCPRSEDAGMQADAFFIEQFLALVALMAATIEYCEVLQRRAAARRMAALNDEAARTGLGGLVRVFIAE
jgi:hypothetical protein